MKKNFWLMLGVVVFFAGLMMSQLFVQAQERNQSSKWVYKSVMITTTPKKVDQVLNELGNEGWKLVTNNGTLFVLVKRQ